MQDEATKPRYQEPTRALAVGTSLYERVLAFFADPVNAARYEEWRKAREVVA